MSGIGRSERQDIPVVWMENVRSTANIRLTELPIPTYPQALNCTDCHQLTTLPVMPNLSQGSWEFLPQIFGWR